jgi:Tol biopolymer transport system component
MTDLRSRFRDADRVPAPDLWQDIVSREPRESVRPPLWPRVAVAAAALAMAALGLVVLARAFLPGTTPTDEPTPTPTGAFRPEPKTNGVIGFIRTDPESAIPHSGGFPITDLYTVEPDGTGARRLVGEQGFLFRTTVGWSPDGSRIAFPWPNGIRVMNADGSGIERLTTCERPDCDADAGGDSHPSWSPTGSHIAFSRFNGAHEELWLVGADGSEPRRLNQELAGIIHVAWSPRGREIAVLGFAGTGPDIGPDRIYLVDVETGQIVRALDGPPGLEFLETMSWSPDGEFLAFDAVGEGGTLDIAGVYVMRADGTDVRALSVCPTALSFPGGCTDMHPAWSPDGTQIAFTRALPERGSDGFMGDIFVIDAEGGDARRVTDGPGLDCCPAWQPVPTG